MPLPLQLKWILLVVFKAPEWHLKTEHKCFFPETISQLLKIIYKPRCAAAEVSLTLQQIKPKLSACLDSIRGEWGKQSAGVWGTPADIQLFNTVQSSVTTPPPSVRIHCWPLGLIRLIWAFVWTPVCVKLFCFFLSLLHLRLLQSVQTSGSLLLSALLSARHHHSAADFLLWVLHDTLILTRQRKQVHVFVIHARLWSTQSHSQSKLNELYFKMHPATRNTYRRIYCNSDKKKREEK